MKRFLVYLFYILLLGIVVYWGARFGQYLRIQAGRTYQPRPLYAFIAFYPIFIGILLAVPRLISRIRQEGSWVIDWQMLLPLGLPTLVFNINILLNNLFLFKFEWYKSIVMDTRVYDISGIICGYVLLASLTRAKLTDQKDTSLEEGINSEPFGLTDR